jgi:predicted lipoprotein with Yx(FWY)xxD motif
MATEELPSTGGTAVPGEAAINVATDPTLGEILVDGNGMTLYMFTKDEPNKSNCSGKCLENWPALVTQGNPTLGEGVDPALVSTATLPDGSLIVTYNGMPLYTFIQDKNPGDVNGQGSNNVWYVVAPDGNPVGYTLPSSTAAATEMPAEGSDYGTEMPGSTPGAAMEGEAVINVATDPTLGEILVDGNGMTLYMYTKDEPNKTNCSGRCLENWPALVTKGKPTLGEGVDSALVGTATLPDGSLIVTYNGMPLYTFIQDKNPGDVTGQDSNNVWYVVSPDGKAVGYTP